jgi:hypothetical protein
MIVVFATPNDAKTFSGYINSCGKEAFSLLFLIQSAAWGLGTYLMIFEY